jgi:exosortase
VRIQFVRVSVRMATAQVMTKPSISTDRKILGLLTPTGAAMLAVLAVAFIALFFRWFLVQNRHSSKSIEDWGHAYIIPLISVYLIRLREKDLAALTPRAFWPGIVPMLLGIMSYFYCMVAVKNHMLQGFSLVLTLYGTLLLVLGPAVSRVLFVPVAYLAFGITISEAIMNNITFRLQLVASQMSELVLTIIGPLLGFSVEASGNSIELITSSGKSFPLTIAEACAGLRMLIAFLALGVAVALVACREWWQRIALVLLAVPVALLMNAVRVTVLGLLTLVNPNLAAGEAHTLIGTLLLVPALGLYMGVVWALNRVIRTGPGQSGGA